jgi:polyisoprenyl-phosphate glycosyltransferase
VRYWRRFVTSEIHSSGASITYSFVLPVYNERENLGPLHARLAAVMDDLDGPSEAILVDDGSSDGSFEEIQRIHAQDPRFMGVQFSRNFGHQAAITAGLDMARGAAVIVMDSDLQHPPEFVPELIKRWHDGYDIVNAVRADRSGESRLKRTASRGFYRVLDRLADIEMHANVGDFRLVDRRALDAFRVMRENTRYLRGMFSWIGFKQVAVPYAYAARHGGAPKYTLRRMVRLGVDGLASFSNVPLQIALHLGFAVAALSFLGAAAAVVAWLFHATTVPGWMTLVLSISFLGGMQLFVLGVIGTYLGRMYDETKNRPLYIVRDVHGFEDPIRSSVRTVVTRQDLV